MNGRQGGRKPKLRRAQVEQTLRRRLGNVSATAAELGVTRMTLYRFIERHNLMPIIEEMRESMIDLAESALIKAVSEGHGWAVCFTLRTLGRRRGYVERTEHEISGSGGGPVRIAHVFDHETHDAAVAAITKRSGVYRGASGEDESDRDGPAVG